MGHFATFNNFTPDYSASFDHEFARLASSQDWVPGSQEYKWERTIAIREELTSLYFAPTPLASIDEQPAPLTEEEQQLKGYRDLCDEIGIPPSNSTDECKKQLKSTLVNIVDLIDARRTGAAAMVWQDFDAFRTYIRRDIRSQGANGINPRSATTPHRWPLPHFVTYTLFNMPPRTNIEDYQALILDAR